MSSRQIMQMLSDCDSSSAVASGYKVFILLIARRESITSFKAFLKFLKGIGKFRTKIPLVKPNQSPTSSCSTLV